MLRDGYISAFKLQIYRQARVFYKDIIRVISLLPKEWQYDLGSQIRRSALSILLNIAEGSAKKSDKELRRYLENTIASANETLAGIDILLNNNLISKEIFDKLFTQLEGVAKQLGGFAKKVSS